ncbi:intein-containing DNA-directed RNA polymerase subunit A'' [Candidatus Woesearchaeota archaeon]|nr:intein-containing DNA-directed RNA polymerase subunit A'' [Candidatus Woesearchaeota archaeon]
MEINDYKGRIPEPLLKEFEEEASIAKLNKKQKEEALRRLEEEYMRARIHPGEAIGVITAESFGEPSTQMSIRHNEKIIVKIKDKIRITKIGEFVNTFMSMNGAIKINEDSEVLPIEDLDIFVPSINQDEKIEWKRIVELSRHKSPNKLIKLTTASGREIVATDNHSFVTRLNNMVVPIVGKGLRTGDRIPVMKYLPEHCASLLTVSNYVNLPNEESFRVARSYRPTKLIPKELKLDWNFGWFIGAYLAEGNATSGQVSISNLDDNYIKNAKKFLEDLKLGYKEKYHHRGFAPSRDLTVNSSLLARLISTTCESGSFNKHVPEFAYSAKDEFAAGLLRGYFDGDGNFHADRNLIRVSSNSKELIDGIALLLSRFKIFSYKVKDKKNQHWLLIPYKYAPLFLAHIGSDIGYKLKALEKMSVNAKNFWNNYSRDYTDMISGFGDLFYETAKKLNYPTRYVNNFTKRQKIGRTALYRYIRLFEKLAKEKNVDINKELKVMHRMFNSDVVWDEIVNIEYADNEYEYVYDLSVPGLETFTTFDGLITHNTLNTFHFAGVAELQVSLGLPRLIEIFDGRENVSTPFMEIFLKKPYNQDQNEVKEVAAALRETKLREISSEFSVDAVKLQVEVTLDKKAMKNLKITDKYLLDTLTQH